MEIIRISKERIGELLGKNGENAKRIEQHYNVKIKVDEEGEVFIAGEGGSTFFAKDVVQAIGRGFPIEDAVKLFKDSYAFYAVDLRERFPSENAIKRVKGRVIGEKGKIKREIEDAAGAKISVYGHTVSIIAPHDSMECAKEAISKIMDGAPHTTVLNYLRRAKGRLLAERLKG
ncbi:MAG: KH domain-containing protein [Candidatus Bilamarchaeaceae archaeon]